MVQRHYLISGHVQGVGYRRFAEREAGALGLRGGARNLVDGRVEVLAAGARESLEKFEAALSRGPAGASVSEIGKRDLTADAIKSVRSLLQTGFVVYRDGEAPWF